MKLATFEQGGTERIGIVAGDGVIDLSRAAPALPKDMIALIEAWPRVESEVRRVAGSASHLKLSDVHLRAPVPRPRKILAIGLNYDDHIAESGQQKPEHQTWFAKLPNAVNGPYDPIVLPKVSASVDYEAELVFVVARRCRHVAREQARDFVFGYCAGNDVSVRDWQFQTSQWLLGKSFDSHAPFGPWLVTPDEIDDPHTLGIRCLVNGERRKVPTPNI